jgi:regulator of RNase E activity RraA
MNSSPVRVTHLADAIDHLGLREGVGGAGLPVWLGRSGATVIGRAYTIQQRAIAPAPGDKPPTPRHSEVVSTLAAPGDLLVIAIDGDCVGATWGEAQTQRAVNRQVAGVLIDGCTRDLDALRALGHPILCRGASPFRSLGRLETVALGGEVQIAGVRVRHGDTIALDGDGFVCIAAEHTEAVMVRAQDIARAEEERDQRLRAGGV